MGEGGRHSSDTPARKCTAVSDRTPVMIDQYQDLQQDNVPPAHKLCWVHSRWIGSRACESVKPKNQNTFTLSPLCCYLSQECRVKQHRTQVPTQHRLTCREQVRTMLVVMQHFNFSVTTARNDCCTKQVIPRSGSIPTDT
jgi:hypothetical protein